MGQSAPWELSDEFLADLSRLIDQEIDTGVKESILAEDGSGVTIYFDKTDGDDLTQTTFKSPIAVCFQVDLGTENGPRRKISLEEIIDYELDEVHTDNLALYESLAVEMERLALKTRARVEEVKRQLATRREIGC